MSVCVCVSVGGGRELLKLRSGPRPLSLDGLKSWQEQQALGKARGRDYHGLGVMEEGKVQRSSVFVWECMCIRSQNAFSVDTLK